MRARKAGPDQGTLGRHGKRMGRFGNMASRETDITELYAPQFEQFGLRLETRGAAFTGAVENDIGAGRAWIMPLSPTCLVMEHFITPRADMLLAERTPEPYACVTEVSDPTLACMPEVGIRPANLRPARGPWPQSAVCSFVQDRCGEEHSPLAAGQLYHSRSIIFLPGYFEELERRYAGEFGGLFEAFSAQWCEEAQLAICATLRRVTEARAQEPAAHVYMRGVVETMVAELARTHGAEAAATRERGGRRGIRLAEEATSLVERTLDDGRGIGVDELATRLYVSRSRLCATFKAETGESVGAYVRRRRMERACELLDGGMAVSQVARRLGYPQQAAFAQAFRRETGVSPSEWAARHR